MRLNKRPLGIIIPSSLALGALAGLAHADCVIQQFTTITNYGGVQGLTKQNATYQCYDSNTNTPTVVQTTNTTLGQQTTNSNSFATPGYYNPQTYGTGYTVIDMNTGGCWTNGTACR